MQSGLFGHVIISFIIKVGAVLKFSAATSRCNSLLHNKLVKLQVCFLVQIFCTVANFNKCGLCEPSIAEKKKDNVKSPRQLRCIAHQTTVNTTYNKLSEKHG